MKELIMKMLAEQTNEGQFRDYCYKIVQDEILQEINSRIRSLTKDIVEGKPLKILADLHFELQKEIENGATSRDTKQHCDDKHEERTSGNVVEINTGSTIRGRSGKKRR